MTVKADVEKIANDLRDAVEALERVPRDLVQRVESAVHRVVVSVRDLEHLPEEPVDGPAPKKTAAKSPKSDDE